MVNVYITRRIGSLMFRSAITFMFQHTRGGGADSVAQRDVAFLSRGISSCLRRWQPRPSFLHRESMCLVLPISDANTVFGDAVSHHSTIEHTSRLSSMVGEGAGGSSSEGVGCSHAVLAIICYVQVVVQLFDSNSRSNVQLQRYNGFIGNAIPALGRPIRLVMCGLKVLPRPHAS